MSYPHEHDLTKKELILNATLDLIQKEGFEGVTVRKISALANVNIGLVNYHFGSKDKLINAAIQILACTFKESFSILDDEQTPPRERLKQFLTAYLNALQKYPFIAKRILDEDQILFESQLEFVTFVKAIGLKKMQNTIQELTGENDPEKLAIMMSHLLGAVFLPTLINSLYEKVTGYPFPSSETRIDILLERYFD